MRGLTGPDRFKFDRIVLYCQNSSMDGQQFENMAVSARGYESLKYIKIYTIGLATKSFRFFFHDFQSKFIDKNYED